MLSRTNICIYLDGCANDCGFSTTTSDVTVISLEDSDAELLPQFVATAHQNVRAMRYLLTWKSESYIANRTLALFCQWAVGLARSTSPRQWLHLTVELHLFKQF